MQNFCCASPRVLENSEAQTAHRNHCLWPKCDPQKGCDEDKIQAVLNQGQGRLGDISHLSTFRTYAATKWTQHPETILPEVRKDLQGKRIGSCLTSEDILNLFGPHNLCVAPGQVPVSIMSGEGQVETHGGGGNSMCTWVQPGSRCAHNLKDEGKLKIRMRHMEGNREDPRSPMTVRSNHPKHYDMSDFLLRKFSGAIIFLAIHKACDCLSKCPAMSWAQSSTCTKEQRVFNAHDLKPNELRAFNSTEFTPILNPLNGFEFDIVKFHIYVPIHSSTNLYCY